MWGVGEEEDMFAWDEQCGYSLVETEPLMEGSGFRVPPYAVVEAVVPVDVLADVEWVVL